jgi:predicted N-formylglutamate amidohydrolase
VTAIATLTGPATCCPRHPFHSETSLPRLSCEHGGNAVPAPWKGLFTGHETPLASHRGRPPPGALPVARQLAKAFAAPLFVATTTRLLST